ncbi:MAG: SGNH/GDSL hydrolase family protein [Verrucomicrobiota bacterium]
MRALFAFACCLGLGFFLWACGGQGSRDELGFEDGDRVIFIGDSLTHSGAFPRLLETYCHVRHPERRLFFRNAGVRGDRVADVLARYDDDIHWFHPDHAIVLLGMNDGGMRSFDDGLFDRFTSGMEALFTRLDEDGVEVIVLGPTYFDVMQSRKATRDAGEEWNMKANDYDQALRRYGAWLHDRCLARGYHFVDVGEKMRRKTLEMREEDASFSLTEDGIHPTIEGDELMVRWILAQLGEGVAEGSEVWSGDAARLNEERYKHLIRPLRERWYAVKAKRYELGSDEEAFTAWFKMEEAKLAEQERIASAREAEIYELLGREHRGMELSDEAQ